MVRDHRVSCRIRWVSSVLVYFFFFFLFFSRFVRQFNTRVPSLSPRFFSFFLACFLSSVLNKTPTTHSYIVRRPHVQYSPSEYFADCKGTDYANQICVANGANYTDSTGVDMAMYSNWMQDRRWDVPKYPDHGRLFFMHIPKTGGTAIEDAAQRVGFAWGRFDRHYDGIKGERQGSGNNLCGSPWHEPFHFGRRPGKVQTFCSIREPIDHLLSEFNFRATPPTCNHDYLQKWVKTKLTRDLMRTRFTDDCHLLSSADYASTCSSWWW